VAGAGGEAPIGSPSPTAVAIVRPTYCLRPLPANPPEATRFAHAGSPGRIAHLSIVHAADDTRIFHKQCRSLAGAGYEVELITAKAGVAIGEGVRLHCLAPDSEPDALPRRPRLLYRSLVRAWRLRAGVYHLHDPHLIPVGLALKLRGARVVYDVHEDYPAWAQVKYRAGRGWGRAIALVWRLLEALARRSLDAFVCANETIAARFPNGRTIVVHNFPRARDFPAPDALPYVQRPPTVLYVGVHSAARGFREAVRAMELVPERLHARLRLVGRVVPGTLLEEGAAHPGWQRVQYSPWQPREVIERELGRARMGLVAPQALLNQTTCLGSNKLFEYMAAGLPVIVADMPGWRWMVEDLGCGVAVDPHDPPALAGAIEHLLAHPHQAEDMGRRGRAAVEARYNWNAEVGRLLALYRDLTRTCGGDGPRRSAPGSSLPRWRRPEGDR
jgi:glycosyltransferase involved in cell wall biosynthesis